MTVPTGYVEGTLDAYDAATYLKKLGIDESLYYDVVKAVIRVPSGYRAISPNKNVIEAGGWVKSADDEPTWEEFKAKAPSERGWVIEEDPTSVYDEEGEGEATVELESFEQNLIQAMGINYTVADLREVALFYGAMLEERRQAAQGNPEELKRINEAEELLVNDLNELAARYFIRKEAEGAFAQDDMDVTLKDEVDSIMKEFGNFTAYIAKGKGYTGRDSFPVTLRNVKGSKVKEGRRDLNLGTLMVSLRIANTPESLATLGRLTKAAKAHLEGGAQAPVVSVSAKDIFNKSITPKQGFNLILEKFHPSVVGESHEDKLFSAITVSNYMRADELTEEVVSRRERLRDTEVIWRLESNIQSVLRGESSEEYVEAVKNLSEIEKTKEFLVGVYSGNVAVQTIIDLCVEGFDSPNYGALEQIFNALDAQLIIGDGSVTLAGMLSSANEDDENLEEKLKVLRETIKRELSEKPLNIKSGTTAASITVLYNAISSALELDAEELLYQNIMTVSVGDEKSVRSVVSKHGESTWDFTKNKARRLSKGLSNMVKRMKKLGQGDSTVLSDPKFAGAIEAEVRKLGYSEELTLDIVKTIQARAETNKAILASAFGSDTDNVELREAAHRGAMALLVSGFQSHVKGETEKFDISGNMARLLTRVLAGTFDGYSPNTGTFFSGMHSVFAEILNRARFFPRLNAKDETVWGGNVAFRDFLINDYLKHHPDDVGIVLDDITLIKHAAHTKSEIPSHYMLVGDVQANAEFLTGRSGVRLFSSDDELLEFANVVNAVNLSNPENAKQINEVANEVDSIDSITREVLGDMVATERLLVRFENEELDVEAYNEISLTSIANYVGSRQKNLPPRQRVELIDKLKVLTEHRMSQYTDNEAVLGYVSAQIGNARGNGGFTGHAFEVFSGIPSLMYHIQRTGIVSAERVSGDLLDGVSWEGEDGQSHTFGKIEEARNGSVDFMLISQSDSGIDIRPVEGKIERHGGAVPHHGNPQHFSRVVGELWKRTKANINIYPQVVTNAPHGVSGQTGTGIYSLSADFGARSILAVGRSFSVGSIHSGTKIKGRVF